MKKAFQITSILVLVVFGLWLFVVSGSRWTPSNYTVAIGQGEYVYDIDNHKPTKPGLYKIVDSHSGRNAIFCEVHEDFPLAGRSYFFGRLQDFGEAYRLRPMVTPKEILFVSDQLIPGRSGKGGGYECGYVAIVCGNGEIDLVTWHGTSYLNKAPEDFGPRA